MKKFFLLTLSILLTLSLSAAQRSLRQAQRLVPSAHHCFTALQTDGSPAFYVFNKGENEGFVIVSADDRARSILGYSDHGCWDENEMPDNLRAWLKNYADAISHIDASYSPKETNQVYLPVAPLIQTKWHQKRPYNDSCPLHQGARSLTGCTAIAASQIMKVHNYPTHGIGSKSYKWANENGDSIVLSANFEATSYNWNNMLADYTSGGTNEQKSAIAQLVYHCGVAGEMVYGKSGSSANSTLTNKAFIDYFGYDKGLRTFRKDYAGEAILMEAIYRNLQAGQPVYISAKTTEGTGHAFVCDGIDANGLLHINWGWGGKSNGYFQLSALAPQEQGAGGSTTNKAYTERVQIFTDIRPDAGGEYVYSLACENVRFDTSVVHHDSAVHIHVDTLRNLGFCPWTGHLKLYMYRNGEFYTTRTVAKDMNPLTDGMFRGHVGYYAKFHSYPNGEYDVVVAARATDQPDAYIPIYCKGCGEFSFHLVITEDSIYVNHTQEQTQGIESLPTEDQPTQKILRDGQVYILRHGRKYTLEGMELKD